MPRDCLRCQDDARSEPAIQQKFDVFNKAIPDPKSFLEQNNTSLLVPVKDGQLVSAVPFTFREMFGVQLDEMGEPLYVE